MFQNDLLKGKNILITGGATGIGFAIADAASRLGANVFLMSRNEANLQKAVQSLRGNGVQAGYRVANIRDSIQVKQAIDSLYTEFGHLDVLINNAAGNFLNRTENISENGFRTIIETVLNGTLNCTTHLGKKWISEGKSGTVLSIVATYAWTGSAFVVPSAVAKAGVLAMTRSLAVEWGPKGVRMNAIAPGPFLTEGMASRLMPTEEMVEAVRNKNPLKRLGQLDEIANLAVFLISDGSGFINGEVVTIDGGEWLMGAGQFSSLMNLGDEFWNFIDGMRQKKSQ